MSRKPKEIVMEKPDENNDLKIISDAINEMMYEGHPLYEARKRGKTIPCLTFFLNQNEDRKKLALIAAYEDTEYQIFVPGLVITLRINCHSAALANLQSQYGVSSSAFLTAYNPWSKQVPEPDNLSAQAALKNVINKGGWAWIEGAGQDPSGEWPAEPSYLVMGISRDEACSLARQFNQNAFVFADNLAIPELVIV